MDLKWFESKVGNKYLNEAAGLAAEKEAASKDPNKKQVRCMQGWNEAHTTFIHFFHLQLQFQFPVENNSYNLLCVFVCVCVQDSALCLAALTSSERVAGEGKGPVGDDEEEEDDMFETEFRQYKRTYYMTKMGVDVVSE